MRARPSARAVVVLTALLVGAHVASYRASAAMWAVLSVSPEVPTVGKPAEVLIRTFGTYSSEEVGPIVHDGPVPAPSGFTLILWGVPYPFRVVALGPGGQAVDVNVHRDPTDASLYRGEVAFPAAGAWTLQLPQFNGPEDAPGIRLAVTVANGPPPAGDPAMVAIAGAIGALAAAVTLGLLRRRAARPAAPS